MIDPRDFDYQNPQLPELGKSNQNNNVWSFIIPMVVVAVSFIVIKNALHRYEKGKTI